MSTSARVGAGVLLAAPLLALVSDVVTPTFSDDAVDRVAALADHHTPMVIGMTVEVLSIALMIGGIVWLASALRAHAPRPALAGGVLGVLGALVVLFEDGLAAASPAIVGTVGRAQAAGVLDAVHTSVAGRIEPLSLLLDVGLICLGAAAVKGGAPVWLGVVLGVAAVAQGLAMATATRPLAVAAFAVLFVTLAGVVRVLAGSPAHQPARAAATAA